MFRVVIYNPKGGSGKTTVTTNLACYYANRGLRTSLIDLDPQASSTRWLERRSHTLARVGMVGGLSRRLPAQLRWQLTPGDNIDCLIIDTPAGLSLQYFVHELHQADAIIIPVLPSNLDIDAITATISQLFLVAHMAPHRSKIAILANRVKKHTRSYQKLTVFLQSLSIPFVASLRDSQNYLHAVEVGASIFEMRSSRVRDDLNHWRPLLAWLERRLVAGKAANQNAPDAPPPPAGDISEAP